MQPSQRASGSDVADRIYRYVERRGAVTREEVRDAVRVAETPDGKPPRSDTEPAVRLPVAEFDGYVDDLLADGSLAERDGRLCVAPDAEPETHEADEFAYAVRPADEADREAVADLIRGVVDEGAIVLDERLAAAVERGDALVRDNDRETRPFFVAETDPEGDDSDDGDSEIVGWVHLQGFDLPARGHTAELTAGVDPEYREQGVGTTLLERGVAWTDDRGYRKVYQHLPSTNGPALELLESLGWQREATRADHYRIGDAFVDEVQMARRLDD